ncbi:MULTISPECIES: TIGR00282 family metallophosphoesterase [Thermoanaerobacter]|uniref:Metallophosphoesterase (TIGR00282 family) n=1 Tax=Thermoanaerobacter pentosaceus TaxID=694059 RepID=A0ABT9M6W6_9THEO|nr:TIGR00282 family metallophosphoesterase [Thermoanaerobacter pentosaceus]MDP9751851.1 metallophosphoesterase (TIGR00282 family) [Thermoanaerobacter pentosaceus]
MKILIIGDIVGRLGRDILKERLQELISEYNVDIVIANGENAAGGNGLTRKVADELFEMGIAALTMGNHVWDQKEILKFIDEEVRIVRPANYLEETPGRGSIVLNFKNSKIGIINLQGITFMPCNRNPFFVALEEVEKLRVETNIILVDFHAEATSEKIAMGYFLDGKVSCVFGTHTHVQTADEKILQNGTAYITDVGMTGPSDSILGIDKELIIKRFTSSVPVRFEVAKKGPAQINAIVISVNEITGKCYNIERINKIYS